MVTFALLAVGASLTLATLALTSSKLPKRRNFADRNIPTAAGIILIPIILVAMGVSLVSGRGAGGVCFLGYAALAGVVGFVDDVWGGGEDRGFAGHLGALARGRVTTGFLKVVVLGGGAVVVGFCEVGFGWRALVAATILAGSANLANLFDLRPGRAFKFVGVPVLVMMVLAGGGAAISVVGIVGGGLGLFYFDLKERIMIGDAGAAILGGTLGYLIVANGPGIIPWFSLVAILGLTAVAEFSSISKVIEEVAILRRFDAWGRGRHG